MLGSRGLAVAALAIVAACGGSSGESVDTEAETTTTPSVTEAPTTTPAPSTTAALTTTTATTPSTTAAPAPSTTQAPATTPAATTTLAPTTTAAPTTTQAPTPVVVLSAPDPNTGVVTVSVDAARLEPLLDEFVDDGSDPYYAISTQQEEIVIIVELHTDFGAGWNGELGVVGADCSNNGICIYLDPDGIGPLNGGGPADGSIEIVKLGDGSIIELQSLGWFMSDGSKYRISGLTLTA